MSHKFAILDYSQLTKSFCGNQRDFWSYTFQEQPWDEIQSYLNRLRNPKSPFHENYAFKLTYEDSPGKFVEVSLSNDWDLLEEILKTKVFG